MTFEPGSTYERVVLQCAEIRLTVDATALTVKLLLWSYDASGRLQAYWIDRTLVGAALADYLISIVKVAGAASWEHVQGSAVVAVRGPGSRTIIGLSPVPDGTSMPDTAFAFCPDAE